MTVVNELKSGNVLTKALSPAKTMGKSKGQARTTVKATAPHLDRGTPKGTKQITFTNRHTEYR